jgi:hypothetical protein
MLINAGITPLCAKNRHPAAEKTNPKQTQPKE